MPPRLIAGARLPNSKREANQKRLKKDGLPIDRVLYEIGLIGPSPTT